MITTAEYLRIAGLPAESLAVDLARRPYAKVLLDARSASMPASPSALGALYQYRVPELSADGTCSLVEKLADKPFDLAPVFGGRNVQVTLALLVLKAFVKQSMDSLKVDWFGVYQVRKAEDGSRRLVKLSSAGKPSRAEFPLTADFEQRSNNVKVALHKKAVVIADVHAHVASGGAYYECDPAVRSEACLPILTAKGEVLGVVDAEHSIAGAFTVEKLAILAACCLEIPGSMPPP